MNNMPRQSEPTQKLLLGLKCRHLALLLGMASIMSALVQLVLGASPAVVAVAMIAAATGLFGFVVAGAYNLGSWVALFYVLGNVLVALYAKTLLGQPLDSHLYAPLNSYTALAVSTAALLVALMLVRRLSVGRPLLKGASDPRFLRFLSWTCFVLGALFWLLNRLFQNPEGSGFGGVALFRDLLLMAVIARTVMLSVRSGDRHTFDAGLALIIGTSVFFGLVDNHKTAAALPVISYFVTVLVFRGGLSASQVTVFVLGTLLFVSVVAPMIHALRTLGQQNISLVQRIEFVASNVARLLDAPQTLNRFDQLASSQFQHGYYNYFGEGGAGQMLLGRYASVQQIDPVITEVNRGRPQGGVAVWPALERLVPSFIYPEKPEYSEAYHTLVHYDLINPEGGKHPSLPLAGQAYSAYGVFGLLTIPFLTFMGFFLVIKKLGWQLYRNVYAIFFFCDFVIVYVNQGDFGHYAGAALRDFPLYAVVFGVIAFCYHVFIRRRSFSQPRLFRTTKDVLNR